MKWLLNCQELLKQPQTSPNVIWLALYLTLFLSTPSKMAFIHHIRVHYRGFPTTYISDIRPSMVTHIQNLSHLKCTHTAVNTHTPWTHTRSSGQSFMLRPGSSWGFGALLKGTSVMVSRLERALYIHLHPPTISAGSRLELATFTSPTL